MTKDKNDYNEGCLQGCLQSIKSILYDLFKGFFIVSFIGVMFFSVLWLIIKFFGLTFRFFWWIFSVSIWLGIVISIISIISIILVGIFVYDTANSDDNEREDDKKQTAEVVKATPEDVAQGGIKEGEGVTNIIISSKDRVNVFVKSDRTD